MTNELKKLSLDLKKKIEDYSSFDLVMIGEALAKITSNYENESYSYQQTHYFCKDYRVGGGIIVVEHPAIIIDDSVKRRLPWLIGTILTASASTLVINHFSGTIQQFVILSAIMPLIANLSGVSGTQTLTILVRNIANNETTKTGVFKVVAKETFVGFIDGVLLSLIASLALYLWKGDVKLTIIFASTIIALQTMSCFIGSVVPLIINKMKLDPAVGSGTFITATLDMLSSLLLLGMATTFLVE